MKVLFLTIGSFTNVEESGLYTDLLREFRDCGHQVYIVNSIEKRMNRPTEYERNDGVHFLKVRTGNLTKNNPVEKGISTIMIEYQFLRAIKRYMNNVKFDLVLYSTPPITLEKVIRYIKKRDNALCYLLLKDIFPQNAVDLKLLRKSSLVYKYFRYKEKKLYRASDIIGCMSQANVDFILNHNPRIAKKCVEVCPNSIDPFRVEVDDRKKIEIRKKYNIPLDKTVFVYGGNLGKPQGIDFLIECLKANQSNEKVFFTIVGSGTEFNKLRSFVDNKNVSNILLLNELPKEEYDLLANSCDVGLIFLDHRFTIPNFPSRILSYMQAAMPVLAATDSHTDIGKVIEQGEFGYWCESIDVEKFSKLIVRFCNNELRNKMGTNARKYLERNYTTKHSYEIILNHFK
ncbi:glycosyltransferase family 4 protein [Ureibacillus endophyticus]|uniref:Glycosyltransferase WbuB n=1 Tax=Ureibacillus endophyticus TaxID=1978490 RepID=A0A494YYY8_9BACL|nr:glycosyltransferase family 4 protein [Lysinibacillus endophyticus]RKQ15441.1 glycosyltransferase WbuB [Lysinibacillus endophyticus]